MEWRLFHQKGLTIHLFMYMIAYSFSFSATQQKIRPGHKIMLDIIRDQTPITIVVVLLLVYLPDKPFGNNQFCFYLFIVIIIIVIFVSSVLAFFFN